MPNSTLPKIAMAKLLHLSRPSKRVGNAVRAWWAMRSQKRRRQRSTATAPTPPVPVITDATMGWDATEMAWADVQITWQIDHGSFPVARARPKGAVFGMSISMAHGVHAYA